MPLAQTNGIHLFYNEAGGTAGFAAMILQHPIFAGYAVRGPAEAAALRGMVAAHLERPAEFNRVVEAFFRKIAWVG